MTEANTPGSVITKTTAQATAANMPDYQHHYHGFTWDDAHSALDGLPNGHLNIAHEAIERHVAGGHGNPDRAALDR